MAIIWIAAIVLVALSVLGFVASIFAAERDDDSVLWFGGTTVVLLALALIVGFMAVAPEYRLWRASIEKRIMVEEARAQADSAIEYARAEVERAIGTAEANLIVADSITEPYLRYLYVIQLGETSNQVIYLPTEAGLPILEAGRVSP